VSALVFMLQVPLVQSAGIASCLSCTVAESNPDVPLAMSVRRSATLRITLPV
jgi:hypothetical protein